MWIKTLEATRGEIDDMKRAHQKQVAAWRLMLHAALAQAFDQGVQSANRGEFICGACWLRKSAPTQPDS